MTALRRVKCFSTITYSDLTNWYLLFWGVLMLIYCSVNAPVPWGEWDDYTLPIASILNNFSFGISDADITKYKELFPLWSNHIDHYSLSPYFMRNGVGKMPWYFPTYAIACIPLTLLLRFMDLPTVYAFPFTNLGLLLIALVVVFKRLKYNEKTKLLLISILSFNPIVFYISWPSGEVFIYSFLLIGLVYWFNMEFKKAAVYVSVAGMLNPVVMSVGFMMIGEYFFRMLCGQEGFMRKIMRENWKEIFSYLSCYFIGILPMIYNYYNIGHINLTASLSGFTHGTETIFSRFLSYLFDLNYGLLPYYPILVILSFILFIVAIYKRHYRYVEWLFAFVMIVGLYSIMIHINCGISGISRYSSWGVLPLIFSVILFGNEMVNSNHFDFLNSILLLGVLITTVVVFRYCPYVAKNTSYVYFAPIAKWVLKHYPHVYNPLHSTFNNRTIHVDGGYNIKTPVVYVANDGYVRKILACCDDRQQLLSDYASLNTNDCTFLKQVMDLGKKRSYISVSRNQRIVKLKRYNIAEDIIFTRNGYNASDYIVNGMSNPEEWGSWTNGYKMVMRMKINSDAKVLHGNFDCQVFNGRQNVVVFVNDRKVYDNKSFIGGKLEFDFENVGKDNVTDIRFELPSALSPSTFGSSDRRILALGIHRVNITVK